MTGASPQARERLHVVDAVRGAAVVFMVGWHTCDAWLGEPARSGTGFDVARVIGGLAAPLFFVLSGVGLGLSERLPATAAGMGAGLRRALGIVVAGYGLRTWAWGVDHSALVEPPRAHLALLLGTGLGLSWVGLGERPRSGRVRAALVLVGACLALGVVSRLDVRDAGIVLRLDVLQGIGAALVLVVLVLAASSRAPTRARIAVPALAALAVALVAPHVLALHPPPGPLRLWDYVARFSVAPAASGARFPFVPWLGYALLGAAIGRAMRGRAPEGGTFGLPTSLPAARVLVVGVLACALLLEAGPIATFVLARAEWARNVDRLAFNTGVAVTIAGAVATFGPRGGRVPDALALLGRHSLVIYAVHLEIAYGLPGSLVLRTFGWVAWAIGGSLLLLSMAGLARAIERREARRPRDHERSSARSAASA